MTIIKVLQIFRNFRCIFQTFLDSFSCLSRIQWNNSGTKTIRSFSCIKKWKWRTSGIYAPSNYVQRNFLSFSSQAFDNGECDENVLSIMFSNYVYVRIVISDCIESNTFAYYFNSAKVPLKFQLKLKTQDFLNKMGIREPSKNYWVTKIRYRV